MGLLSIIGGIVRLVFAIKSSNVTEEAVMTIATTVLTGVGLILAGDASASVKKEPGTENTPAEPKDK